MLTSTIPVAGIVVALFAAAASVSATALTAGVLWQPLQPASPRAALPARGRRRGAHRFRARRRDDADGRFTICRWSGMILLAAGIAVFRIEVPSSQALTLVGSGLTGIGLGATVAPALFVAGFSLPAANLQRVFAIVELHAGGGGVHDRADLRPLRRDRRRQPRCRHRRSRSGSDSDRGRRRAIGVALYALGGARPQTPDLETFLAGEAPAWYSPPLLARLRSVCPQLPCDRRC